MYKRRPSNNYSRRPDRSDRFEKSEDRENVFPKKYSKSKILLKSSVFALFIILITLIAAFIIIKNKKGNTVNDMVGQCQKHKTIIVKENIDEIVANGSRILVLTKADKNDKQEIITINAECGNEVSRISLQKSE